MYKTLKEKVWQRRALPRACQDPPSHGAKEEGLEVLRQRAQGCIRGASITGEDVRGLPLNSCLRTSAEGSRNTDKARHWAFPSSPSQNVLQSPPGGFWGSDQINSSSCQQCRLVNSFSFLFMPVVINICFEA